MLQDIVENEVRDGGGGGIYIEKINAKIMHKTCYKYKSFIIVLIIYIF